jgi:hypothetical protein
VGRIVCVHGIGQQVAGEPPLAAIDRLLKVEDRTARLLGLDAPTRVDSDVSATVTQQPAGLDDLILKARGAGSRGARVDRGGCRDLRDHDRHRARALRRFWSRSQRKRPARASRAVRDWLRRDPRGCGNARILIRFAVRRSMPDF